MPETFFFSATSNPVRYSAKCRRSGALAKTVPNCSTACCTRVGNSMIPGITRPPGRVFPVDSPGSYRENSHLARPLRVLQKLSYNFNLSLMCELRESSHLQENVGREVWVWRRRMEGQQSRRKES